MSTTATPTGTVAPGADPDGPSDARAEESAKPISTNDTIESLWKTRMTSVLSEEFSCLPTLDSISPARDIAAGGADFRMRSTIRGANIW